MRRSARSLKSGREGNLYTGGTGKGASDNSSNVFRGHKKQTNAVNFFLGRDFHWLGPDIQKKVELNGALTRRN